MVLSRNPDPKIQSTWLLAEYILREMKLCAHDLGADLMIVPLPFIELVRPDRWRSIGEQMHIDPKNFDLDIFIRRFKTIAENQNLLFVDPLPNFLERSDSEKLFTEYHHHFNSVAHETLAQILYEGIAGYQFQ